MTSQNKFPSIGEMLNLTGKKALVTGGARGIGYAIVYRLAEAGATVTIVDLNSEKGNQAAHDLAACGYSVAFLPCNVSREEEVKRTVSAASASMHGLDILVNNAGIFPSTPVLQMASADMDSVLAVNIKGVFYMIREAAGYMIEHNTAGSIINIASIDSVHPSHKNMSLYDASKGAVLTLTRSLAKELGPAGIRVNAIAPGGILTEGALSQKGEQFNRAGLKEFMSRITLGRMGKADDIGRVALFLASDLAGYMTGSLITVDGGYLLS
jgi:2-dehydro-3-deoxy-D-gluconate 5-dehydrogenase